MSADVHPSTALEPPRILCAKCGGANPVETELCAHCGRHLYVFCHCGARTLRSSKSCQYCGDRLRTRRHPIEELSSSPTGGLSLGRPTVPPRGHQLAASVLIFAMVAVMAVAAFAPPEFWFPVRMTSAELTPEVARPEARSSAIGFSIIPLLFMLAIGLMLVLATWPGSKTPRGRN